jgi:hypothetical protein
MIVEQSKKRGHPIGQPLNIFSGGLLQGTG